MKDYKLDQEILLTLASKEEQAVMKLNYLHGFVLSLERRAFKAFQRTDKWKRMELKRLEAENDHLTSLMIRYPNDSWIFEDDFIENANKIDRIKRYFAAPKNADSFNIQDIKKVDIGQFLPPNTKAAYATTDRGYYNCIWHNEKTPSMVWFKKENRVHCFGCGKHGDVIDVYKHIHNLSTYDALKQLSKYV